MSVKRSVLSNEVRSCVKKRKEKSYSLELESKLSLFPLSVIQLVAAVLPP
jgi:hypothetical protein